MPPGFSLPLPLDLSNDVTLAVVRALQLRLECAFLRSSTGNCSQDWLLLGTGSHIIG